MMIDPLPPGSRIGIIGGGQLGRMMAIAASHLGYRTAIFDPSPDCPGAQVTDRFYQGEFNDQYALAAFMHHVDCLTYEFENIPVSALEHAQEILKNKTLHPPLRALYTAQHRVREKTFARSIHIPTPHFESLHIDESQLDQLYQQLMAFPKPAILKTAQFGYDGKGQWRFNQESDISHFINEWKKSDRSNTALIIEQCIDFDSELSIIVARNPHGDLAIYPAIDNQHINGILHRSHVPSKQPISIQHHAQSLTAHLCNHLDYVGVMAVEWFVTRDQQLLFNEMAPRPHNSGHWTIDAAITCQFEQHIRAITNLPLGNTDLLCPAMMENLIGSDALGWNKIINNKNAKLHLYGKEQIKDGRKMGHATFLYPK
jgi:5-(carboxyamino)imidazole ribonucleotide synthase